MDAKNFGVREKIMCTIVSLYRGIKDKTSELGHPPTLLLWPSYTSCQKITPVNLSAFFLLEELLLGRLFKGGYNVYDVLYLRS